MMTGRYLRKTVPLEIRGLSQVTVGHPTSALEIVEHQTLPHDFSNKIVEAISSYQEETPLSSNRSSPTITEENASTSPSIVQGDIWGTGNTTERSSVDSQYSWDEFDRQAAKNVQNLFDEIDSVLYERRNQAEYIHKECQEWVSLFPHLRVLGRQLLPVQEVGYEVITRELSRPNTTSSMGLMDVTDQDLSGSQDSQGLSVSGKHLRAIVAPVEARSRNTVGTPSTHLSEFSFLEEEVYESEGEYEEIIAVDYKDIYEDHHEHKKQLTPRRRRVAYPPITPNACFKDSVASAAFDCMWQEIISWIRPLLRRYSNIVLDDSKQINPLQNLSQTLRNASTPGPPSRENSQFRFSLGMRAQTMIGVERTVESPKLDGVLKISQKIPIHRETSKILSDVTEPQMSVPMARPVSSIPTMSVRGRPGSTRYQQGGRGRGNIRLAPISHDSRSKTPSVDEERVQVNQSASMALLVKKINPPGIQGRLSSPLYNTRNGALPPIGTPMELEPNVRLQSETPQGMGRRASTPFNNSVAFNNSSSRNFGGMQLDIRGNGLQPSQEIGNLGNIPQEILEDPENIDETVRANQWK
ncbi:hypothetical protein ACF0H5_000390 [Mactra antiquata]